MNFFNRVKIELLWVGSLGTAIGRGWKKRAIKVKVYRDLYWINYTRALEFLRGIHPIKKQIDTSLTSSEDRFNRGVSVDRFLVEKYLGRLATLWSVLSHPWRWPEGNSDNILWGCVFANQSTYPV